ncbi:uncharacterized protein LOC131956214 [Physella acuta]|uniref:uncharacterized protein LOC131956214 n=1 Tax=Physella acuta TaxID=109671 RepID=UPI0027DB549A|nr:uncharacterized protein LOC131956214 [Physella acuta]
MSPLWLLVLLPALTLAELISDLHDKLDKNKDGELTKAEIMNAVKVYDSNNDTALTVAEFFNFSTANLGNLLQQAMAWGKYIDKNKDKLVSTAEFNTAFQEMDANGNGKVTKLEYLGYAIKMVPYVLV